MDPLGKHLTKREMINIKRREHKMKQEEAKKKKKQEESKLQEPELVSVPKNPLLLLENVKVPRKLVPIEHTEISQLSKHSKKAQARAHCNMPN